MDREAFSASVRAMRGWVPFQPFTIAMLNGERHEVDRPEILAVGEKLAVLFAPGDVPVFFDHTGVNHVVGDLSGRGAELS